MIKTQEENSEESSPWEKEVIEIYRDN